MKRLTLIFVILQSLLLQEAFAQKHDYNWVFGDSILVSFNDTGYVYSKVPFRKPFENTIWAVNFYSSYSDKSGNILYYQDHTDSACCGGQLRTPASKIANTFTFESFVNAGYGIPMDEYFAYIYIYIYIYQKI